MSAATQNMLFYGKKVCSLSLHSGDFWTSVDDLCLQRLGI